MEDLAVRMHERYGHDILFDIEDKMKSDYYLDKINIKGKFNIFREDEDKLILSCHPPNAKDLNPDYDMVDVYLPLPIRFDEEWFKKFKELNICRGNLISYYLGGV